MHHWIRAVVVPLVLLASLTSNGVQAQVVGGEVSPGWSYQLVPYLWLPSIDLTAKHPVPGGGIATTTVSESPGQYIPTINIGFMGAGEVRYSRFSVLTDVVYSNNSTTASKLTSVDFAGASVPFTGSLATSVSGRTQSTIWTFAGGYTAAYGQWGNVDIIGGFRLLAVNDRTDFSLSAAVIAPDGTVALSRFGGLSVSRNLWNGVGGVRGRIYLAKSRLMSGGRFFVPFYFDVGGGGVNVTWQVFSGIGYQTRRLGVTLGYRYLAFDNGSAAISHLGFGGPILIANLSF